MRVRSPFKLLLIITASFLVLLGAWRLYSLRPPPAPDYLFFNGTILSMEPNSMRPVQALLVQDGLISAMGSRATLEAASRADTVYVDLQGRTLMPGFIEPHTHVDLSAFLNPLLDLGPFTNTNATQIWKKLQAEVDSTPPGHWIMARGLEPAIMSDLQAPSLQELDAIAPQNPLFIVSQTLHSAWVNSLALEAVGLNDSSPDPSKDSYYGRDAQGKLNGYVHEIAAMKIFNARIAETFDIVESTRRVLAQFPEDGITTVATTGVFGVEEGALTLFEYFSTRSPSLLHRLLEFFAVLPRRQALVRHFVYLLDEDQSHLPETPDLDNDFYRILGVKFWYDGSVLGMTDGQTGRGYSLSEFTEKIETVHQQGWQIAIHANDTWAIEEALAALQEATHKAPAPDLKHRIEHATRLSPSQMDAMAKLGVSAGFQLNMLHYYGDLLAERMPPQALHQIYPMGSAARKGLVTTLHSDAPAFPQAPLHLVEMATTRQTTSGAHLGPEETIKVHEGLKATTLNAARQLGMEAHIGSLVPGKYADLVILACNPLTVAPSELGEIDVLATYIQGRRVFQRASPQQRPCPARAQGNY